MKEVYIAIGEVLCAYKQRSLLRANAKGIHAHLEMAKKNVDAYGMYADCGDSYKSEYTAVKAQFDLIVQLKISSEKHCKKLRLEFAEKYPDYLNVLLEKLK
ncbi:MAG: hypothetical protein KME47_09770 [Nodosilinea sp. WJT8-NPBG4]|nr:hypothetical protein [Nodosilinea sp. WJT8-NPBG4]